MSESLSRRERRKLLKEEAREKESKSGSTKGIGKWAIGLLVIGALAWGGYSLFKGSSSPLPGEIVPDAGRDHVTDIYGIEYTSNPPTSGTHFPVWAKPGVYDRFLSDGYLIHSMEHGYIIIWYDCSKLSSGRFVREVYAHDEPVEEATDSGELLMHMKVQPTNEMSWFTPQNPPEEEIPLPESFKTDSCKSLVSQLSEFTKAAKRVIIVPRMEMDALVAVTAWGRIDKLDSVDEGQIKAFISAFHNRGPEQTQE